MEKRGQITIFIIAAIIIIALAIGFVLIGNPIKEGPGQKIIIESERANQLISSCLKEVAKEALETISSQGGFYDKPKYFIELGNGSFYSYYIYNDKIYYADVGSIEKALEKYMNNNSGSCAENSEMGVYSRGEADSDVKVIDDEVKFDIDMPVVVEIENRSVKFDNFNFEIKSQLKDMINVTNWLSKEYEEDIKYLCVSCLSEIANEKDIYVEMISYKNDSMLWVLITNKTDITPEMFTFMHKYKER